MSARRVVSLLVLAVVIAALSVPVALAGGSSGVLARNHAVARAYAARLLAGFVPPSGATPIASDASNARLLRHPPTGYPSVGHRLDRYRFWLVPGDLASLGQSAQAHPPAGFTVDGYGSSGSARTGVTSYFVTYVPRRLPAGIFEATVTESFADASGGHAVLRVDVWVAWLVPRPSWERVPASARVLTVSTGRYGFATVTDPARVAAVAAWVNRLAIVQPGEAFSCPGVFPNEPLLTLSFSRSPGGAAVARTTEDGCVGMTFSRGGRSGPLLYENRNLTEFLWARHVIPACHGLALSSRSAGRQAVLELRDGTDGGCGVSGFSRVAVPGASVGDREVHGPAQPELVTPSWPAGEYLSFPGLRCGSGQRITSLAVIAPGAAAPVSVPVSARLGLRACAGGRVDVSPVQNDPFAPVSPQGLP